jgi:hypothetical protein
VSEKLKQVWRPKAAVLSGQPEKIVVCVQGETATKVVVDLWAPHNFEFEANAHLGMDTGARLASDPMILEAGVALWSIGH